MLNPSLVCTIHHENSLDHLPYVENHLVTASREAPIFDVYPDPVESSQDSLDFITNALAKIQLKSCQSYALTELLDNLREVTSIDDLPFQHGTPLTPVGNWVWGNQAS